MPSLLFEKIKNEIANCGPIAFSRYMELCLYDAEFGYYTRGSAQFGKAGDFYTSGDVHPVFGRLLTRQFDEIWRLLGSPRVIEILELGPGRGWVALDVLDWSERKFPDFFAALHYRFLERSPALREQLRQKLAPRFQSGKCSFVEDLPATEGQRRQSENRPAPALDGIGRDWNQLLAAAPSILLANEFFDALPFEVLSEKGELRVAVEAARLVELWCPPSRKTLEYVDRYGVHPEAGERIEVNLVAQDYAAWCAQRTQRGFFMAIDYGYTQDELIAGRHRGTLMTYHRHGTSSNPYQAPGDEDITAHVNFTAIQAALEENGMRAQKLITQSQFLIGIGEETQFRDAFEDCPLLEEHRRVSLQLKLLVTPAGLGESFHVQLGSKGVDAEQVSRLSGLKFQ
jgi:SAM-dependent MidA family methyltransferase